MAKTPFTVRQKSLLGIAAFAVIIVAETLHHLPGLAWLDAFDGSFLGRQLVLLAVGIIVYAASTFFALRRSINEFEQVDL